MTVLLFDETRRDRYGGFVLKKSLVPRHRYVGQMQNSLSAFKDDFIDSWKSGLITRSICFVKLWKQGRIKNNS